MFFYLYFLSGQGTMDLRLKVYENLLMMSEHIQRPHFSSLD